MDLIHTSLTCFHLTNFFVEENSAGCLLKTKQKTDDKKVFRLNIVIGRENLCAASENANFHSNQPVLRRQPDEFFSTKKFVKLKQVSTTSTQPMQSRYYNPLPLHITSLGCFNCGIHQAFSATHGMEEKLRSCKT